MPLGGGTFTSFTKVLPGVYINVRGTKQIKEIPIRGYVALAMSLTFGENGFITVNASDIEETCLETFGYEYKDEKMLWLREIINGGASTIHVYNISNGEKASGTYCTAKYPGTRGNDIKITVEAQADSTYDVITYVGTKLVDSQNVSAYAELIDNAFVVFDKTSATLESTSQTALTGGTDGTVQATAHETFLQTCESKYVNIVLCTSTDATTQDLYAEYARKYVEETALKTQVLLYNKAVDFYGALNVAHPAQGSLGVNGFIYWFAGAIAGCKSDETITNKPYTGELYTDTIYQKEQLETAIKAGKLVFNTLDDELIVAKEINSLTTYTDTITKSYSLNQHIRIINDVLVEESRILNQKHSGKTRANENGIGDIYSDLFNILVQANENGYIEKPVSSDLSVSTIKDVKDALAINQKFITTVCVDTFYIDTIAD